ncbi:MAG: hypothetical protein QG660_917, partial [Pseudomonadota bacterium]|nr:hypothetical protein [Pseudomonadota bacterium]
DLLHRFDLEFFRVSLAAHDASCFGLSLRLRSVYRFRGDSNACSKAGQMESLAKDISSTDATALQASIATLTKQCQARKGDVEGALFDVHEEFHRLIEPKKGA